MAYAARTASRVCIACAAADSVGVDGRADAELFGVDGRDWLGTEVDVAEEGNETRTESLIMLEQEYEQI